MDQIHGCTRLTVHHMKCDDLIIEVIEVVMDNEYPIGTYQIFISEIRSEGSLNDVTRPNKNECERKCARKLNMVHACTMYNVFMTIVKAWRIPND